MLLPRRAILSIVEHAPKGGAVRRTILVPSMTAWGCLAPLPAADDLHAGAFSGSPSEWRFGLAMISEIINDNARLRRIKESSMSSLAIGKSGEAREDKLCAVGSMLFRAKRIESSLLEEASVRVVHATVLLDFDTGMAFQRTEKIPHDRHLEDQPPDRTPGQLRK